MNKQNILHIFDFRVLFVVVVLAALLVAGVNFQTVFGRSAASSYVCDGSLMSETELAAYRGVSLEIAQDLDRTGLVRFAALCDLPQASLDNALLVLEEIGSLDDFRLAQLQDENGEISAETYLAAQEAYQTLLAEGELNAATAGITSGSWNWIGPGNIGGRVRALAVHPSNPDIIWAGGIAGGIWKTTDGGASWQMQDDYMVSMAVTSIVVNPINPNILYAATGEGFGDAGSDKRISRWIFKSTDGGATWTQLDRVGAPASDTEYIHRLAISPDGSTLLAATEDGILRCREANIGNNCQDVTDWVSIYATGTYEITDLDFSLADSNIVVAGGENGLVIRSANVKTVDLGGWTEVALESGEGVGMGRAEVAYASGSTVYVSAAVVDTGTSLDGAHVYKSTDDGAAFTRKSPADAGRTYLSDGSGNEANLIWVDPTDSAKLVVGGEQLYRSTDSGVAITQISDSTQAPNSAFSWQHIAVAGSGNQVIVGTDGGVYRADDIDTVTTTSGWTELNNNLGITEFYCVNVDTSGNITGNTRNTGTIYHAVGAGSEAWTQTAAVDCSEPVNPDGISLPTGTVTKVVHYSGNTYYATLSGYANTNVQKTTNGGAAWTQVGTLPLVMPVYDLVIRPGNPNHLYIGTEFGVFITENANLGASATWSLTYAAGDSPTSSPVQDLDLDGTTLIAATYGRGVFTAEIGGTQHAYDDFDNAHDVSSTINTAIETGSGFPYQVEDGSGTGNSDTTSATRAGDDPAIPNCNLAPGDASVWYKFKLDNGAELKIDTLGSSYDTYLAVWTGTRGSLNPVACNDNVSATDADSHLAATFAQSTDYYLEVGQTNGELSGASVGGNLKLNIDDTVYSISGTVHDDGTAIVGATVTANTGASTTTRDDGTYTLYPVPDGEIEVTASKSGYPTRSQDVVVSTKDLTGVDFNLTDTAKVDVEIGGDNEGHYVLESGSEIREYYDLSGGPVVVGSVNNVEIVSAIRLQSKEGPTAPLYSFIETMGVPKGLLSHKYYFPTYNNTWSPLNSQIRFGNINATATTIRVTIGGNVVWEQSVPAKEERRLYFDVSDGPVIIESLDSSKKIVAAIRLQSKPAGSPLYSFSETLGIPDEQVSSSYYFPTYNNTWAPLNSQLRVGNLSTSDTTVKITIGSQVVWQNVVKGLNEERLYFNISGGPVKVESLDTSKKIVAAIRLQSKQGATAPLYSFVETMGVPEGLLSYKYYFPTYNNTWAPLNSQIRFGNLNASATTIRVTIGGNVVWQQSVPGREERRLYFDVSGGPVIIESLDTGKDIVAAIRLQSKPTGSPLYSFSETLGISAEQMSDTYYFPTYNNTWSPLNSQLRFGMP